MLGEMVFPGMFNGSYSQLTPLKQAANIIAECTDWSMLYHLPKLKECTVPCAAIVYDEDMYVDKSMSIALANEIPSMKVWLTNEYLHSGLRDDGERIFEK